MHPLSRLEQEREQLAAEYLRILQEFSYEIDAATRAITRNALSEFEESVRRQEELSGKVREVVTAINASWEGAKFSIPNNPQLSKQVGLALKHFQRLNLRYAALLKHSSHSIALMSSLCRTYSAEFPAASGTERKQTWSCEA